MFFLTCTESSILIVVLQIADEKQVNWFQAALTLVCLRPPAN